MSAAGFFAAVLTETAESLRPLERFLSTEANFEHLLEEFGWTAPEALDIVSVQTVFSITNDLDDLQRLVDTVSDTATVTELPIYYELFTTIQRIVTRVRDLVTLGAQPDLPSPLDSAQFWSVFPSEVVEYLLIKRVELKLPVVYGMLQLFGVISETQVTPQGPNRMTYTRYSIAFDRLSRLVTDFGDVMRDVYGWGDPIQPLDHELLLKNLQQVLGLFGPCELFAPRPGLANDYYSTSNATLGEVHELRGRLFHGFHATGLDAFEFALSVLPIPPLSSEDDPPNGLVIAPLLVGAMGTEQLRSGLVALRASGGFESDAGLRLLVLPDSIEALVSGAGSEVDASIVLRIAPPTPWTLIGGEGSHGFEIGAVQFRMLVQGEASDPDVTVDAGMERAAIVVDLAESDSFLRDIIGSDPQRLEFDLAIGLSSKRGLVISGQGGLELTLPVNRTIGVFDIDSLTVALRASDERLDAIVGVTGDADLGPIVVSAEKLGVKLSVGPIAAGASPGLLGGFDAEFGFKPPDGLGILLDAGAITGGGFLEIDPANARYAGVLQLEVYGIAVSAIGLLDTRLPGGASGFSFLILISTQFTPIQLGFGFTLNGVGGLAGIHRTLVVEALQTGIRSQRLDAILFPEEPIEDAAQLISDLRSYFPPAEDRYVFGPMALIGWGTPTLLEAKLGILLEVPDPVRLVLLGQISAHFPTKDAAVVELHIDVLGVIDFGEQRLAIDARLHDSRVALFTISGDMALRLAWGDAPVFVFSLGGFNPRFTPPPEFPALERLTIALGLDENPRISLQAYLALTSNSLQLGAKAELLARAGDFSLYGWITFDALVIFSPFYFIVDFSAGVALRWDGDTIAGIHVTATLEGPTPWHAWGEACLSILFFDICVDFDARFGEERRTELPPSDPWPALQAAISDPRNWSAALPAAAFRVVTVAPPEITPPVLVDPVGSLTLRETVVPLNRVLTKFGETTPAAPARYDVRGVTVGDQAVAWSTVRAAFAAGQFQTLSDNEKLTRQAFEQMDAGVTLASAAVSQGEGIGTTLAYETVIIDSPWESRTADPYQLPLRHQRAMLGRGAAARAALRHTGLAAFAPPPRQTRRAALGEDVYVVASTTDLQVRADITAPGTQGETYQALSDYVAAHPAERDTLQVIPVHEGAAAA